MTVFRKPKSNYLPVHTHKLESVQESITTFYKKLADHQQSSGEAFDEFIDIGKIIPNVISFLLENKAAPKQFMTLARGMNTHKQFSIAPTVQGQNTATVYCSPIQTWMVFGGSQLMGTKRGRDMVKRMCFYPAQMGSESFAQSNAHLFLWWDTLKSRGLFLKPIEAYPSINLDLSQPLNCSIIMCTQTELTQPKTIKRVFNHTGYRYSFFNVNTEYVQTSNYPVFGTFITVPIANTLSKAILSQKAAFFRRDFLRIINDLIFDNRIWQMAFVCSATGRQKTIEQYISHIRTFSEYTGKPVSEIFDDMSHCRLSDVLLRKFFFKRLSIVNIDTVIQGIHAFNWFYKRFHQNSDRFHKKVVDTILRLRKRLKEEPNGSDSLTWTQMKRLLAHIKLFKWGKFSSHDIYNLALISLWGALRISESAEISRLTTVFLKERDLLRVNVWDAKSATGDTLQWKYISSLPEHPKYCPHKAYFKLATVSHYQPLVSDSNNKPITTSQLSTLFRKFINSLKEKDILPRDGKFTWHVFRVSYMNISFHEFGLPLHFCAANACHQALTSSEGYVSRQAEKRRMLAAKNFALKASEKMTPETDPVALAFLALLDKSETV